MPKPNLRATTRLYQCGNSVSLYIPAPMRDRLGVKDGDRVSLQIDGRHGQKLCITKLKAKRRRTKKPEAA